MQHVAFQNKKRSKKKKTQFSFKKVGIYNTYIFIISIYIILKKVNQNATGMQKKIEDKIKKN